MIAHNKMTRFRYYRIIYSIFSSHSNTVPLITVTLITMRLNETLIRLIITRTKRLEISPRNLRIDIQIEKNG